MSLQTRLSSFITAIGADVKRLDTIPRYRKILSGRYYGYAEGGVTTAASVASRLHYMPFWLSEAKTFDRIGIEITTAVASTNVRLGIYGSDVSDQPGALLLDAGLVASATVGAKEITVSQALTPGLYWLAAVAQGGTPTWRANGVAGAFPISSTVFLTAAANGYTAYYQGSVTGALPANATVDPTLVLTNTPRVLVRAV